MGKKIVLTGVSFTDNDLPRVQPDAMLPEAGALILIDPAHSASPWPAGAPVDTATVPNIAAVQLGDLLSVAPDSATLKPSFNYGTAGTGGKGTTWQIERSTKGGLHGIVTQTTLAAGQGAALRLPTALLQYLVDHATNDLYVSLWGRLTRRTTSATFSDFMSALAVNSDLGANRSVFGVLSSGNGSTTSPSSIQAEYIAGAKPSDASLVAGAGFMFSLATTTWRTTVPTTTGQITGYHPANWGEGYSKNNNARSKGSSWVFYRYYIEDLTVSGRTYAEVAALDAALFTAEVMTTGGRYYGDTTPTAPSAIP